MAKTIASDIKTLLLSLNTLKASVKDSVSAIKNISSTLASLTNSSNAGTTGKTSYSPRFDPFSGIIDLDSPLYPRRKEPYLGLAFNLATSNLDPPIDIGSKEGFKDTITSSIVKELSKKAYTILDDTPGLNIEYLMANILKESRNLAIEAYRVAYIAKSSNSTSNSNSNPSKKVLQTSTIKFIEDNIVLSKPTNNTALEGELVDLDLDLEGAVSPDPSNLNTEKLCSIEIGPSKLEPYESSSDKAFPQTIEPIFAPKPIEVIGPNQPITNEPLNNSDLISERDNTMQLDYYKLLAKTSSYILSFVYKARKRVISKDSTPTTYKQVLKLLGDKRSKWLEAITKEFIQLLELGVFKFLPRSLLSSNCKLITCRNVLKVKKDAKNRPIKYKSRTKDYSICFSYNGNTVADLGPKLSSSSNTTIKLSRDFYSKEGPRPLTTTSTTIVDSRNGKGSSRTSIINSSVVPIGFSDSDFTGDKATSKSTYSYLYKLASGPISWKRKELLLLLFLP
ncbi:hypothetical protein P8C59_003244 [Phyllachora maydis]|uniref:Uncharacterized protein n=1 Tax=Phyllachora maydis TaxID=1825666 RepID=A0AAD9MA57_9PEZI|nr:hypothetical protein P8C59_003244 [Phyllachora maydis]